MWDEGMTTNSEKIASGLDSKPLVSDVILARKHDPWLTIFLGFAFIASAAWLIYLAVQWNNLTFATPIPIVLAMLLLTVVRMLTIAAIWHWSKAGVILYIALSFIGIFLDSWSGSADAWKGLIGVGILIWLVRKDWALMQWSLPDFAVVSTPSDHSAASSSIGIDK
jgi:hypothetical protein